MLISALAVTVILAGILIYVVNGYNTTPFSQVFEGEGRYIPKNDLLIKVTDEMDIDRTADAFYFNSFTGDFFKCAFKTLDMTKFGFSGELDYYVYSSETAADIFPMYDMYDRFASRISFSSLVYRDTDGKKYIIDPKTADTPAPYKVPYYSGSYDNEDIYAVKADAVSSDGFTSAGIEDDILYVSYFNGVADPETDEYRGDHTYSLKEMGLKNASVVFFVNARYLWITAENKDGVRGNYVVDAYKGAVAACPAVAGAEYDEEKMNDYYVTVTQTEENSKGKKTDKYLYAQYCNVVTGNIYTALFTKDEFSSARVIDVGSKNRHFLAECTLPDSDKTEIYVCALKDGKKGKYLPISQLVPEGGSLIDAFFIYDNVIMVCTEDGSGKQMTRAYKMNY